MDYNLEMANIFDNKVGSHDHIPKSDFRVPKSLRETKPEAFTSHQIGLGPYYALMQKHKLEAVRKFLNSKSTTNPEIFQKVVEAPIEWPGAYSSSMLRYLFLDLDVQTLALILTIDGLYLLQFLDNYGPNKSSQGGSSTQGRSNIRCFLMGRVASQIDPGYSGFLAERGVPAGAAAASSQILSSMTKMTEFAGVKFILKPVGIREVQFVDHEGEKKFYLPVIKLNSTSEIVLRNLVAFEAAAAKPGSTLELAEYVDLMCGIIDTPKDVSILKNEKIIESEMSDEEIARIFNGISKSTKETDKKSKIDETIEGLNKKYNSVRRVKVERFLKKYAPASFNLISRCAYYHSSVGAARNKCLLLGVWLSSLLMVDTILWLGMTRELDNEAMKRTRITSPELELTEMTLR
ncbi:hypothetical protein RD792_015024 [Penstemon davidsonii]|uniref:Uncharacterized protein n=1 Tax=Penstemon davidsonii TaxID=160366 RepID=A0ABR0CQY3_9LAMI|nr:hypothetical protein RD792_015024 [Penstemon davidsonii]